MKNTGGRKSRDTLPLNKLKKILLQVQPLKILNNKKIALRQVTRHIKTWNFEIGVLQQFGTI